MDNISVEISPMSEKDVKTVKCVKLEIQRTFDGSIREEIRNNLENEGYEIEAPVLTPNLDDEWLKEPNSPGVELVFIYMGYKGAF